VLTLLAVALVLAACGDDDDEGTTTTTTPAAEAPGEGTTQPSVGGLPPGFVECMADQGYAVESSADIHSAPQNVLQACFGAAH
jgi:hypothetical protein